MKQYSITSNEAKLLKHLDSLKSMQDGKAAPVMLLVCPTNKCNQNCTHCCFGNRDKTLSMNYEYITNVIGQFKRLGIKSVEYTGGGEPTLHKSINEIIDYCSYLGLKQGMNSNCIDIHDIGGLNKLDWLRIALNVFDNEEEKIIERFKTNVNNLKHSINLTACYVVPKEIGTANLDKVIKYSNKMNIITRICPDCIQSKEEIVRTIEKIKKALNKTENKFCFCSDFNIYLGKRPDNFCAMHYIKPILYTDGNIYVCPSTELDVKNGRDMQERFKLCKGIDAYEYYTNQIKPLKHNCEYCKYAKQNELLYYLTMETENNEFV